MESYKDLKEETQRIKDDYVTNKEFDAVMPQFQRVLDEVRGDIKKLLVIVHNSNGKKKTESN